LDFYVFVLGLVGVLDFVGHGSGFKGCRGISIRQSHGRHGEGEHHQTVYFSHDLGI
jgi:hypothetical protein